MLNVDTRSLPVTWRFALDWVIDDWRNVREVHECILGSVRFDYFAFVFAPCILFLPFRMHTAAAVDVIRY